MSKTGMLGCLISKIRQPQLSDPPETLKFRRIDQANQQIALFCVGFEAYYVMN